MAKVNVILKHLSSEEPSVAGRRRGRRAKLPSGGEPNDEGRQGKGAMKTPLMPQVKRVRRRLVDNTVGRYSIPPPHWEGREKLPLPSAKVHSSNGADNTSRALEFRTKFRAALFAVIATKGAEGGDREGGGRGHIPACHFTKGT